MPQFSCPYCATRVAVELAQIEAPVACSSCERPFRPQLPEGILVEEGEAGWHAVRPMLGEGAEERTLRRVRPAAFRRAPLKSAALFLGAGLALAAAIGIALQSDDQSMVGTVVVAGVVAAIVCLAPLVLAFVETRFETLTVTSQRSLWRRGIFSKSTSEVQHDDIRNIQVKQGLLDQLLRVGAVSISSAGQDDMEIVVSGVPRPTEFVEMVRTYQRRLERDD